MTEFNAIFEASEPMNEAGPILSAQVKPFPTIWKSIGWVLLFFALQIVISIIAVFFVIDLSKGVEAAMATLSQLEVIALPTIWALVVSNMVTLALLWLYIRKPDRLAVLGLDRWSRLSLVQTIGVAVGLIGVGFAFNYGYETYVVPDVPLQQELRRLFAAIPQTGFNRALLFFAGAILAPIVEELVFRGLLQTALAKKLPVWAAILIASSIFGAMHLDFYATPVLVMMGVVFGILYHVTGSLRVTILLHVMNNAAALALTS
jgi:hypothetical protein